MRIHERQTWADALLTIMVSWRAGCFGCCSGSTVIFMWRERSPDNGHVWSWWFFWLSIGVFLFKWLLIGQIVLVLCALSGDMGSSCGCVFEGFFFFSPSHSLGCFTLTDVFTVLLPEDCLIQSSGPLVLPSFLHCPLVFIVISYF